jgi:hypothetical protein
MKWIPLPGSAWRPRWNAQTFRCLLPASAKIDSTRSSARRRVSESKDAVRDTLVADLRTRAAQLAPIPRPIPEVIDANPPETPVSPPSAKPKAVGIFAAFFASLLRFFGFGRANV